MPNPIPEETYWNKFPDFEQINNKYIFEIKIDENDGNTYVSNSGTVYTKTRNAFKVTLSFRPKNTGNMFVRCMLVHNDEKHLPVKRCINHRHYTDGVPEEHILKCFHPETQYVGSESAQTIGESPSMVVPLDRPAVDEQGYARESLMFAFLCQNSCATGISRRPTAVVFTLENARCEILGKCTRPFKVSSCPKREMKRDDSTQMPPNAFRQHRRRVHQRVRVVRSRGRRIRAIRLLLRNLAQCSHTKGQANPT